MKVPCLVWLQGPWSPVGYDVVELPATYPQGRREIPEPPRSPLGYRVVELDPSPGPELPDPPPEDASDAVEEEPPRRQPRRLGRWGVLAVSGSCLALALVLMLVLVRLPAQAGSVPLAEVPAQAAALPAAPAAAPEGICLAGCQEPGREETFGTAVAFVRNTTEAGRIADQQHKLLFLLHVSGNFEDTGFT
jgi:hypothetical protein